MLFNIKLTLLCSHTIESDVWTSYAFNGRPVTSRQNSYQDSCTPSDVNNINYMYSLLFY